MKRFLKYVGILVLFYALYIVIGLFLLEKKHVVKWTVLPGKVIRTSGADTDYSGKDNDGPHIFYNSDMIYFKAVLNQDSTFFAKFDTLPVSARKAASISCTFSKHPEWNFMTRLKDTLMNEPAEYAASDSILAISDIEGNFFALRNLLTANQVMSSDYKWTFGNGHLVLVGDIFDRGLNVTECLWLIYHLEQEAEKAGGKVHLILGNHEIMNLSDDIRFVRNKYIQNAELIQQDYKTWYESNSELGRWLQTKNIIEKIGTTLFMHGGFSSEMNELKLSLADINSQSRPWYFKADTFKHNKDMPEKLATIFKSATSPFWYRGYVNDEASEEQVDQTLKQYGSSIIVVGHTIVPRVTSLYNGKVIAIDTKHADGISEGIIYVNHKYHKIDQSGRRQKL